MFPEFENVPGQIICILDTAVDSGRFLIRELIKELISNSKATDCDVLCFDTEINKLGKELGDIKKTINFHDCLPLLVPDSEAKDDIDKFLESMDRDIKPRCIVLDSLSTLFLQKPAYVVHRNLHHLLYRVPRIMAAPVVFVVHEDTLLTPKPIIAHLKLLCNIWIRVQDPKISITIYKGAGKTSTVTYSCSSSGKKIVWNKEQDVDEPSQPTSSGGPVSTFKLTLSESEKKARDAVKLPYERYDTDTEPGSSAAIIYEPDEFDDWDEEDPDNDLEFS